VNTTVIKRLMIDVTALCEALSVKISAADESKSECKICLDRTVVIAFIPCGHLFCQECGDGITGTCPMCNNEIQRRQRIYF